MNLTKLFEMQRVLDERIIKEKGLEGKDLLPGTILALLMELGELANELPEYTKHWSNKKNNMEKALIEYVDGLHFILSIGLQIGNVTSHLQKWIFPKDVPTQLTELFYKISELRFEYDFNGRGAVSRDYKEIFDYYLHLGWSLGFPWEEIEIAYYTKNAINHSRQGRGY